MGKMLYISSGFNEFLLENCVGNESRGETAARICGFFKPEDKYEQFKCLTPGSVYKHPWPMMPGTKTMSKREVFNFRMMKTRWIKSHGWKTKEWGDAEGWNIERLE